MTFSSKIKKNSSSHILIYFWKTNKAKLVFFQEKKENEELVIGKFQNFLLKNHSKKIGKLTFFLGN
ncbi:unnamed protein product [Ceutorhynchus assimilis]|uniref:Uncharacterized protein n=1 Tax=Ceutorhynchus assimilis TaxID=467358 RepID=A0A9N9MEN7_9CUCU|nr:unnamed protein product [Ceutorhynchus assimilis]